MIKFFFITALINVLPCFYGNSICAQQKNAQFYIDSGFLKLPDSIKMGLALGLSFDSKGNLYVIHNGGRDWEPENHTPIDVPVVLKFSPQGNLLKAWGENMFARPHMINLDKQNNVWVVDRAMQQVQKFSADGTLLQQWGEKYVVGNDREHFNHPTDVAFSFDGSFYVSDGYRNARVVQFSRAGKFVREWGTNGSGQTEFRVPHSIAVHKNRVYVADRQNERLQVFDRKGRFVQAWKPPTSIGKLFAVTVTPKNEIYMSFLKEGEGEMWIGTTVITDKHLHVKQTIPAGGHDIAVDKKGIIYLAIGNTVVRVMQQKVY